MLHLGKENCRFQNATVQVFHNWAACWPSVALGDELHWAFVEVLEITQRELQTSVLFASILLGKLITVKDKSCSYTIN